MLFYKRRYLIRHKVLKALNGHKRRNWHPDCMIEDISLLVRDISERIKVSEHDIWTQIAILQRNQEVDSDEDDASPRYFITGTGEHSFEDKKYPRLRWKEFWDEISDPVKIVLPILALGFSAWTYFSTNHEKSKTQQEIEILKKELEILKLEVRQLKGT